MVIWKENIGRTEDKKLNLYSLYTIHAEVIRDAVSEQITSIEERLVKQGHTLTPEEKNRLRDCLRSRHELLDPILRILNADAGAIKFDSTPRNYYSST